MKVTLDSVPQTAFQIAREQSFRINPDLLKQYIVGRIGGLRKKTPAINRKTIYGWVDQYNNLFNSPVNVKVNQDFDDGEAGVRKKFGQVDLGVAPSWPG